MEAIVLVAAFALIWFSGWVLRSAWFKGKVGERQIKGALQRKLNSIDYLIVNDIVLPTRDHGTTQIDHLVISRFGVFVIETKNMSGWIFGSERSAEWTQVIFGWKSRFQNPLRQNYKHVKAVQHTFGLAAHQVHNVVVFVGTGEPKTEMPDNVIWGKRVLPYWIKTHLREVIDQPTLDEVSGSVTGSRRRLSSDQLQRQTIDMDTSNQTAAAKICARCGAPMVERVNGKTGEVFWGCSEFPKCKNSAPLV